MKSQNIISIAVLIVLSIIIYQTFFSQNVVSVKEVVTVDSSRTIDTNTVDKKIKIEGIKGIEKPLQDKAVIKKIVEKGIDTSKVKPVIIESETIVDKDSNSVKFSYIPSLKEFDFEGLIKEKIIHIRDSIKVYIERTEYLEVPFYEDPWFWSTLASIALLILALI